MNGQRALTEAEREELDALTDAIDEALRARTRWLDAKMVETSELQVGDDIYDLGTGLKVGVVTGLYRFSKYQGDLLHDDTHYCDYRYERGPGYFDNTSRQYTSFGTREQAIRRAEAHAAAVRDQ